MSIKKNLDKIIIKFNLYDFYYYFYNYKYKDTYLSHRNEKKIYLLMEPTYGNLGDQAIALATKLYLKENFGEYKIICVDLEKTYKHLKAIKSSCNSTDLIFLQGGGNMGNLYPYIENIRRFCFKHLRKFKVISMPTTVTYTEDIRGKKDLEKSIKLYGKHGKLTLIAREIYSYDFMNKHYKNAKVLLIPDMVFYLYDQISRRDDLRKDYLVCIRREMESNIPDEKITQIITKLANYYPDIFIFDTTVVRRIFEPMRELEVYSLFKEFLRAKIIVTDRMHGMIIAAITGTPCVVMKSLDNKVNGSYQWIKDINYIELIEKVDFESIRCAIKRMELLQYKDTINFHYEYFVTLKSSLKN